MWRHYTIMYQVLCMSYFKSIGRIWGGGGVESILIRSLLVNWRLGHSFIYLSAIVPLSLYLP
jgi:hypothetical protein